MDSYIGAVKHLHLTFVVLSFALFLTRGYWMMVESSLLYAKPTKILPHVIDTGLLVSALVLAVQLSLNPAAQPWLMAKIVGLVVYIVLGTIAIKPGRPKSVRSAAFVLACITFMYIVACALTKSPGGFFAYF